MSGEGLVSMLTELGLSVNDAKVYLAMLDQESFTATQAATKASVPRQMVYRVLSRLTQRGLCMETSSSPRHFTTTDPKLALKELISQRNERLNTIKNLIPELSEKYDTGRDHDFPIEYVRIIRDPSMISALFIQMNQEAKEEVFSFVKPPFSGPRPQIEKQQEQLIEMNTRHSVNIRALYEVTEGVDFYPDLVEHAMTETGEKARLLNHLPLKATVVDLRKILMFLPDPGHRSNEQFTVLYIEHPDLGETLHLTFDSLWAAAEDYWHWRSRTAFDGSYALASAAGS